MRCSRCSTEAAPDDEFCAGCGTRLRGVRSSDVTVVGAVRPAGPQQTPPTSASAQDLASQAPLTSDPGPADQAAHPGQSQPGQSQPVQWQPGQSQPGQWQPGQSQPGQAAQPVQWQPGQSQPGPAWPGQPAPGLQVPPAQGFAASPAPGYPPQPTVGGFGYPGQPPAPQAFPAAAPGQWPGAPSAPPRRRGSVALSLLALLGGLIGAGLIFYVYRNSLSSSGWFLAEPLGVAILSIVAGVLVATAIGSPGRQWLGSGLLLAFGVNILLGLASVFQYSESLTSIQYEDLGAGAALLLGGLLGVSAAARKRR